MHLDLGLTVNTDKSKVVVLRKNGCLGRSERWFIGGNILEVVNGYLYLGFTFTTAMNADEAAKQLAVMGKKSPFELLRPHTQLGQMCRQTFFNIFDAVIQPVLSYSAEVWELLVDNDPTEKVHLYACKRFLNVAARTPNEMVYGELGRHPLKVNYFVKAVKFWFRGCST